MASLSRQLAQWIVGLQYEHLPPAVVDRARGVTLQCLSSILLGANSKPAREARDMVMAEEEGVKNGATILVHGGRATRGGAAFVNSEMAFSGGKWDTFRMLMHPGTSVIPAALAAAEATGASGREFLTAVAAGYEVPERLAAEVIPTLMARGFHASPVFGIFGAAVAAAKIYKLDEEQTNSAIALAASMAGGNLEGARSGGRLLREGAAVRNALLAVALARQGHPGGETVLEGEAGFYHAYIGNNRGELTHSFSGKTRTDLSEVTKDLGREWIFLETLYRIYSLSGYNIAHIDLTARLCEENDIRAEDIESIEAVVNWLETQYPSPAFPSRREDLIHKPGSTAYFIAYAAVARGFPMLRDWAPQTANAGDPPQALELMQRVSLIPAHNMPLFGPRITIRTRNGKSYTVQGTGREFIWDFEEQARRIRPITSGLPITAERFEEIIAACRGLDTLTRADALVPLMLK
ncbi:MAG TPA: MmgE/PrpD family protein [Burkholderiales bacterium]